MSRISGRLQHLKTQGKKALIPYIVAGDPSLKASLMLMHQLVSSGADILEIGVPFSDPMAEGPVIQLAHERALLEHVSLRSVLELVADFRKSDDNTPIVLMGYANPVENMGYKTFSDMAAGAGVDGLLTVDMPPEEAEPLSKALSHNNIDMIYLLAPTTTDERIKQVIQYATGYLYYVSLKGVTGAANIDLESVKLAVNNIKQYTELPISVGFGIKDSESARTIGNVADGVVVGSALVDKIARLMENNDTGAIVEKSVELIAEMRIALDAA